MNIVTDLAVYLANGFLVLGYALVENAPQLASVACAVFIALTFDHWAQQQAVFAPTRYERGRLPTRPPRTAQLTTGVALAIWLTASWALGAPVPLIGAGLWFTGLLALLMMPQQRWSLLWTTKAGLVLYSLTVVGYRLYLWQAEQLSPAQLSDLFGGAASAASVIAQNQGAFATVGAWLLWVVLPAGYMGVLLQNWVAQPMMLVNPLAGARDILTAIRTRGNSDGNEARPVR